MAIKIIDPIEIGHREKSRGSGPMIMMGYRTGSEARNKTIDYATGEEIIFDGKRRVVRNKYEEEAAAAAE